MIRITPFGRFACSLQWSAAGAMLFVLLACVGCDEDLGRLGARRGSTQVSNPPSAKAPSPPSRVQEAPAKPRRPRGLATYRVEKVLDGDTIVLSDGTKVRYIGVDSPESVHPSKPVQHYGPEASKANKRLVLGKRVGIQYDVERKDRYGRTLAYGFVHCGPGPQPQRLLSHYDGDIHRSRIQ